MTIVMGLDQHRAQITAEWIDTATGEVSRAARRAGATAPGVRRFAARFRGQELEVALEATTGWRFVVEEFGAVGARVHLAEPAETAARRGTKKRAKSDRADARHLRELLMVGRLPESWIPPEHLLDLRARVGCATRSSISAASGSSASRPCSITTASRRAAGCSAAESRAWLAGLRAAARRRASRSPIALAMIDAHDAQLAPLDRELRAYAAPPARLPGADAPLRHRAADRRSRSSPSSATRGRFSSSREAVRYAGLDITVHQSDARRAPGRLSRQGPSALRWALFEAAQCARRPGLARPRLLHRDGRAPRRQPRLPGRRAQAAQAQLPHPARTRRGGPAARMTVGLRAQPSLTPMHRGRLPACSCRHHRVDGLHRQSGRTASPSGTPHQPSCRRPGATPDRGPR